MQNQKVISLLPSATEIVCALGARDRLVGRSHECDYPGGLDHLPACTAPKFDIHGSSGEIDRQVKSILENALAVYKVDADDLRALEPDVIVTQSQCDVCAVSETDLRELIGGWLGGAPELVSLEPNHMEDVYRDFARVGVALDEEAKSATLVERIREAMGEISEATKHLDTRPTIACIEWLDPLMAAGNWIPELVDAAGGANLFGETGVHSPWLEWSHVVAADPEIIVVMPCGFDIARASSEMLNLTDRPEWAGLSAVRAGKVFVVDGHHYFNRPGPRLLDSLEILCEIIHPDRYSFGHRGSGWVDWVATPA